MQPKFVVAQNVNQSILHTRLNSNFWNEIKTHPRKILPPRNSPSSKEPREGRAKGN